MTRLALPPLYAIVDPLDTGRGPVDLAVALLAGGARVLQLRLKASSAREVLEVARAVQPLVRQAGALLIVNDRPDVARAAEADGGLELLRTVRAAVELPLVAIGGITPETAASVRAAGADAVAMIAALVRAPDVAAAVRDVLAHLGAAR